MTYLPVRQRVPNILTRRKLKPCPATAQAAATANSASSKAKNNFHLVLHSVYKSPSDATQLQLEKLEALTLERIDQLNTESLVTVMYALARAGFMPSQTVVHKLMEKSPHDMHALEPRLLQHLIWTVCRMGVQPSQQWGSRFSAAVQVCWIVLHIMQTGATHAGAWA